MSIPSGFQFGPYEVVAPLGAGGMGEVYRAKDSRLKREVALKVLPPDVAADRERLARFQREAEVLASLNHVNIAQIYGLEGALAGDEASGLCATTALAMELVEGEDLAQRLARGHLPVDEALAIDEQIAAALEAAHERGIIHRDLKPANIKLRPDGMVKVLDFGLAKAMDRTSDRSAVADVTNTPTLTSPARTMHGMILGTAAYMAPEQAKGKPVDQRADIWAFGCVLFEMLTGQRAFGGDDVTDTITSVLRDAPDLSQLPAAVPSHVRSALQSCLEKDPRRRWRSIGDVQLLLGGRVDLGVAASAAGSTQSAAGWRMKAALAALVLLTALTIALAVAVLMGRRPAGARPVARFSLALPAGTVGRELAITPDGSKVIFVGDRGRRLYVRSLDALDPVEIASGVVLGQPSVSPDGRWVSFIEESTKLRKVPIAGGPATGIANLDGGARGIAWLTNDTLIVGTAAPSGLLRVSASGAEPPAPITTPDGGVDHLWPAALPGRRAVLFSIEGAAVGDENQQVAVFDIDTGRMSVVVGGGGRPRFVTDGTDGYIAYAARGKTFAVFFNVSNFEVPSGATPLDLGLQPGTFAVSAEGTLVYRTGNETGDGDRRTLVWVDRSGRETPIEAQPRLYEYPQISPDGARAAVADLADMRDLWIWQFGSTQLTRFTLEPSVETAPIWTPDGKRLVFASNQVDGRFNLWWQAADGSGSAERLTSNPHASFPTGVSPDGKLVVYWTSTPTAGRDLMTVSLEGSHQVTPLLQTPAHEWQATISPDGRWVAYESNSSGEPNVHVRPFPRIDQGQWQVSTGGGRSPLWSRDGNELFFLGPDGALMRVPVTFEGSRFAARAPARLFETRYFGSEPASLIQRTYDVSPDGRQFLVLKREQGSDAPARLPDVVLVQNWAEDLKRQMPKK